VGSLGVARFFMSWAPASPGGAVWLLRTHMPIDPESHGREQGCNSIGVNDEVSQFDERSQILRRGRKASLCGV
jgi:hypothetical protein